MPCLEHRICETSLENMTYEITRQLLETTGVFEEAPTGQGEDSLLIGKDNNCDRLNHIKNVKNP